MMTQDEQEGNKRGGSSEASNVYKGQKYYTLGSNYELNLNLCIGQINTLKEGMSILNDTLFPSQKKGTILLHPRHIICIDIFTITQCVLLTSPFNFKAVFFIDLNCRGVIDKHG
ncbi:hypothetical protein HmCmsJML029_00858 [Escherichia coli]|nr:hypothetical protein HmCmsJML029_00858 [Escherichia coli]